MTYNVFGGTLNPTLLLFVLLQLHLNVCSDRPTTQQRRHQHSVGLARRSPGTLSTGIRHQQCRTSSVVLHMGTAGCRSAPGVVVCSTVTLACPEAVRQDPEASWEIEARNTSS